MKRRSPGGTAPTATNVTLVALAALVVLAGLAAAGWFLALTVRRLMPLEAALPLAAGCLVGSFLVAATLWSLVVMIARQYRIARALESVLATAEQVRGVVSAKPAPPPPAPASLAGQAELREILVQLAELNANLLLTDDERRAKHLRRRAVAVEQAQARADRALAAFDLPTAEAALEDLTRAGADGDAAATLRRRIEQARAEAERRDVEEATRRCHDLMALASFDSAREAAEEAVVRHPRSPAAAALLDRVRREASAFSEEQRRRLYADVERAAGARQWRAALQAAQALVERFPGTAEADAVAARLEMLRDNAQIEQVRELRDRIRDRIRRQRFAEALALAEQVVEEYPHTAAAEELRGQIDRLRERAEQP